MKRFFHINDTLENKITYLHLLLFAISLPFDRFYSQLFLISLTAHTLIQFKAERLKHIFRKEVLILQSIYLLTVIGTTYTQHKSIAFGIWEKQVAIFLFPLLLLLNPIDLKKYTLPLLAAFALINTLVILYLYYDAFHIIRYFHMPLRSIFSSNFLSHNFSAPIPIHATYLSLFCSLSLLAVITTLLTGKLNAAAKCSAVLAALVLSAGLVQLSSRSVWVATIAIFLFVVPFFCANRRQRLLYIAGTVASCILLTIAVYKIDALSHRIAGIKTDLETKGSLYSIADPRGERWSLAWNLINHSPVYGYGAGEELVLLKEQYFIHKLYDSYLNALNAHNQYLSLLLKGGILALAGYLVTLLYSISLAVRRRNIYLVSFLLLITIVGISENILDVNKGIFFYSFFLSLFVCGELKINKLTDSSSNPTASTTVLTNKELLAGQPY